MIYHLSHEFDGWWFQNTDIFVDTESLIKTLSTIQEEVERSKETFIKTHKKKYKEDRRLPPCWKTLEPDIGIQKSIYDLNELKLIC